ncbi:sensor histidine kinase [Microbacterium marinilacus]|uniref:Sensor-like histidine kinase SenX3 n=2 Tax=Microbacterium marinilacus TaxID=415209 RepID=A0ABP7B5G3_9MICO
MQLAAAVVVVAVCALAFGAVGVRQLRAETESTALGIARTAASDPQVRAEVAAYAGPGGYDTAALADGPLQQYALAVAERTGALFVVIADDDGIRLAHPEDARLGQRVSTGYEAVLAGHEVVEWESGTLGSSVRAKVPVPGPDGDGIVGEVSVGFATDRAFADAPALAGAVAAIALVALALALLVALVIRRRLERLTRGVQPDELAALLQSRAAVLEGVHDGVIAVSADRVVRACNPAAAEALSLDGHEATGRPIDDLDLPPRLRRTLDAALAGESTVHGELVLTDRVVFLEVHGVRHDGDDLGVVAVLRDRTDVVALAERLDAVRAATNAMRAQRHEFANRMHVASGMLAAGRVEETRALLAEFADRGALPEEGQVGVAEPFLRSFLAAKAVEAGERGVDLRLGDDTLVLGTVHEPEDAAAVLGNLIDNAVTAAVAAGAPRWVEVTLLDDGDQLALTVADSGRGVDAPESVFERARAREDEAEAGEVHGRGIGLPLARRFSRRRGGELWVVSPGGEGHGAVFGARLPGVMLPAAIATEPDRTGSEDDGGQR